MDMFRILAKMLVWLKTSRGLNGLPPEETPDGMPNAESVAVLKKLADEALRVPGEPLHEHRARFEERRRAYEAELAAKAVPGLW